MRVALHGEGSVVLPFTQGQIIVRSGETTRVEVSASSAEGRIAVQAESGRAVSGGAVRFISDATGESYGPYAMDADGFAVSDALPAGHYHLESVELPDDTRLGALFADEREIDPQAVIEVKAGQAVSVRMQLLTLEKQRFSLMRAEIGEDGARQETAVQEEITVDLCTVDGTIVTGDIPLEDGGVTVEALSGEYVLQLAEKDAAGLDVLPQSEPFELPGREETVVFESTQTRTDASQRR